VSHKLADAVVTAEVRVVTKTVTDADCETVCMLTTDRSKIACRDSTALFEAGV